MPGISVSRIPIPFRKAGIDFRSYWATQFTGVPLLFANNPLVTLNDPLRSVVKVGNIYYIYTEREITGVWQIFLRRSYDGINIGPESARLFNSGAAGSFDELGQADPTVIYDGPGDWKMWFDAKNGAGVWDKIGYATSTDGITWTKVGDVLDKGGAGTWESVGIHHPICVKENGVYYMIYCGGDTGTSPLNDLGLATSTDGINFTKYAGNPVIEKGTAGQWDSIYVRPSIPVKIYNKWYMWYWGLGGGGSSFGLATSDDLITWTKQGEKLTSAEAGVIITASSSILKEGTNPLDRYVANWFTTEAPIQINLISVALPITGTRIGGFSKEGSSYGDTTPGTPALHAGNYVYFNRLTVGGAFNASAINIYINNTGKPVTGNVKLALYDNISNTPKNLLAVSEEKSWLNVIGNAWTEFRLTTTPALTATDYWVAIWSDQNYQKEKGAGGANNWGNLSLAYGASFPNPVTATTNQGFSGNDVYLSNNRTTVFQIALLTEPSNVYFNTIKGNKVISQALVDSEFDWFWGSDVLYVYSSENPDVRYQITYD